MTLALEGGISKVEIDKLYSAPDTFAKFRDEIEKGIGPVRVWIEMARNAQCDDLTMRRRACPPRRP